jgi:hypothetical protein
MDVGSVRYAKAFAVFSKLPFANEIGDIPTILHNSGIEPVSSFIAKNVKDASDRVLILEAVEDVFFNSLPVDIVVIASGDIDFYPFVSFFYEHSNRELYLLSFKDSLNSLYKELPLTSSKILFTENLISVVQKSEPLPMSLSFGEFVELKKRELDEFLLKRLEEFEKHLISKLSAAFSEGKEVKTGLLIKSWLKEWNRGGANFSVGEVNYFLDQLQERGIIKIEGDDLTPLRGKILKGKNFPYS